MKRSTYKRIFSTLVLSLCMSSWANGTSVDTPVLDDQVDFQVEEVASGLSIPWAMAFISPDEIMITERGGTVRVLDLKHFSVSKINGLPDIWVEGQGGLLDVAIPPDFQPGGWIYFTYSKPQNGQGVTALARAKLTNNHLKSWQDLLVTQSGSDTARHFGSRIAFDHQGHLFFSVGDRGVRPYSQNRKNHAGTILRLNLDGTIPTDNPFVDEADSLPEIWSYGHRNPQGIAYDAETNRLWSNEHGPRGGDEINLIKRGKNYGWPIVSYGKEYWGPISVGEAKEKAGMESPIKVYIPSIAPGSMLLYSGKAFPQWRGDLFSGALKLRHLNRIKLDSDNKVLGEQHLLTKLRSRIRALAESPEGWIYLSTDSGRILRLKPRHSP